MKLRWGGVFFERGRLPLNLAPNLENAPGKF